MTSDTATPRSIAFSSDIGHVPNVAGSRTATHRIDDLLRREGHHSIADADNESSTT